MTIKINQYFIVRPNINKTSFIICLCFLLGYFQFHLLPVGLIRSFLERFYHGKTLKISTFILWHEKDLLKLEVVQVLQFLSDFFKVYWLTKTFEELWYFYFFDILRGYLFKQAIFHFIQSNQWQFAELILSL